MTSVETGSEAEAFRQADPPAEDSRASTETCVILMILVLSYAVYFPASKPVQSFDPMLSIGFPNRLNLLIPVYVTHLSEK
jgi:hypothetical protein